MTAHVHAALMLQYAQDAAETNTPWLLWELSDNEMDWYPCSTHPAWNEQTRYRHKKTVIKIGRFEFPKPMTRAPKEGTDYFYLDFGDNGFVVGGSSWAGDDFDMENVAMNVSHLSHKDAQTHADVLSAICRGNV
nr:MAG TPA: hypothetical protein [Caudoviricetes sp.]